MEPDDRRDPHRAHEDVFLDAQPVDLSAGASAGCRSSISIPFTRNANTKGSRKSPSNIRFRKGRSAQIRRVSSIGAGCRRFSASPTGRTPAISGWECRRRSHERMNLFLHGRRSGMSGSSSTMESCSVPASGASQTLSQFAARLCQRVSAVLHPAGDIFWMRGNIHESVSRRDDRQEPSFLSARASATAGARGWESSLPGFSPRPLSFQPAPHCNSDALLRGFDSANGPRVFEQRRRMASYCGVYGRLGAGMPGLWQHFPGGRT